MINKKVHSGFKDSEDALQNFQRKTEPVSL